MHSLSVEHRAVKVAFVNGLSSAITIALQLISVPICLNFWGKETYGTWLSLVSALMLLRSVDAGFTNYVGNKINLLYHDKQALLQKTLASSIAGVLSISFIQLLVGILLFSYDVILAALGISLAANQYHQSGAAFLLLAISWVLTGSYLGIVHRLLIPVGMMYQAAWWAMGYQISQFFGMMIAALMQFTVFQASMLFAFIQASIYIASALYIRKKLPEYYPWWRGMDFREGVRDLGRSLMLTMSSIFQQVSVSGIVLVVSSITGPAAVPIFTTVRTVANLWTNVTNVLTNPLLPDVVRYHVNHEEKKLVAMHEAHWAVVGTVVNLGLLVSYPFIKPLYEVWTRHSVTLNMPLLCLLLSSISVANAGALINTYLAGINNIRSVFVSSVVRGMVGVIGSIAFVPWFGLAGLGFAIVLGEAVVLIALCGYFFRAELEKLGGRFPTSAFVSLMVSVFSVLSFFVMQGMNLSFARLLYPLSIMGTLIGGWRGWIALDGEVRQKLLGMLSGRYRPR